MHEILTANAGSRPNRNFSPLYRTQNNSDEHRGMSDC